jgi:hypothetical protein
LRSGSVISTSSSSIGECKGIVYRNSRRLLKLNSNTAGLPSVAEAGVITVGAASLSLIVPVAEAVPEQ